MKIAIIDSGIQRKIIPREISTYVVRDGSVYPISESDTSPFSHGSLCARIICRGLKDAEITGVQIYQYDTGEIEDLYTALSWCIGKGFNLINLSNGTLSKNRIHEINDLCYQLWVEGTKVIAAVSNTWNYTVPACLPYVTGVERGRFFHRKSGLSDVSILGIVIRRKQGRLLKCEVGNSFACARYCRLLAVNRGNQRESSFLPIWTDFSLLKDICLWTKNPTDQYKFTFTWKLWDSAIAAGTLRVNLLVMDGFESPELSEMIQINAGQFFAILWYSPFISKKITKICRSNGIKIWKLPAARKWKRKKNPVNLDTFIIVWIGCEKGSLYSVSKLKQMFEKDKYNGLYVSRKASCYLYGFFYLESVGVVKKWVKQFTPDLIIIDSSNEEEDSFKWDILISESEDGILQIRTDTSEVMECSNLEDAFSWIIKQAVSEE